MYWDHEKKIKANIGNALVEFLSHMENGLRFLGTLNNQIQKLSETVASVTAELGTTNALLSANLAQITEAVKENLEGAVIQVLSKKNGELVLEKQGLEEQLLELSQRVTELENEVPQEPLDSVKF